MGAGILNAWEDKHGPRGGRPVRIFTLRDSGNGNTTSEIPEKTEVVLPLPVVDEGGNQACGTNGSCRSCRQIATGGIRA